MVNVALFQSSVWVMDISFGLYLARRSGRKEICFGKIKQRSWCLAAHATNPRWLRALRFSGSRSGNGFVDGCGRWDEGINPCEFEKLLDVGANPDGDDAHTPGAGANEMTDDEAKAGGVHGGDVGDVEDVEGWALLARRWFEFEDVHGGQGFEDAIHVVRCKGSAEPKDEHALFFIFNAFDFKLGTLPQLGSVGGQCKSPWNAGVMNQSAR